MFCPNCGKQLPENSNFCRFCGADLRAFKDSPEEDSLQKRAAYSNSNEIYPEAEPPKAPSGMSGQVKLLIGIVAGLAFCVCLVSLLLLVRGRSSQTASSQAQPAVENTAGQATDSAAAGQPADTAAAAQPADAANPDTPAGDAAQPAAAPAPSGKVVTALVRPSFFDSVAPSAAPAESASVPAYEIAPDLSNVNTDYDFYFSDAQKNALASNGFFINAAYGSAEFYDKYEMNRYRLVPNFVTVDSMMHTYHLYFAHLLKNVEKEDLRSRLASLSTAMLAKSAKQLETVRGSEWENAAARNTAFFAVGATLLGADTSALPSDLRGNVDAELQLIMSATGITQSPILGINEDYSQYIPRGYYEGDADLESYFRAMMWFGRMNFKQKEEDLDRSALLMTLCLDGDTLPSWEAIYSVTSFFAGASDDCGYYEYRPIIDAIYGADATAQSLVGNDAAWQEYHFLTAQMPAPKINSVARTDPDENVSAEEENKGYRFMGQRFSIDAAIFQNLVHEKVKDRTLPNALDIPAAFGSDAALSILEAKGETSRPNYMEQMNLLRANVANSDESLWNASLYSRWLYTLRPLLTEKGDGYPAFMRSNAWARKNLQSFLGSYTELKHDTVLYSKQMMVEMGGDPEIVRDDRGYVEPEPEVFSRLSVLTQATMSGLSGFGMLRSEDEANLQLLKELADRLCMIAEKELRDETLTNDEYELIRSYGGQLEHFWQEVYKDRSEYATSREFPAAIVTDVATDATSGNVLELGTGHVSTIYVVVPVDGSLRVASGAVFSFYQFPQPLSDRLTDSAWRKMMGLELDDSGSYREPAKSLEDWTFDFQFTQ